MTQRRSPQVDLPPLSGFAMIPGWIFSRGLSAGAIALYVLLAEYGTFHCETGTYEECRPARATMARRVGTSVETIKRLLTELVDSGAVTRTTRSDPTTGARIPSAYTVQVGAMVEPSRPGPRVTDAPGSPVTRGGGSPVTPNPEVLDLEVLHPEEPPPTPRSERPPAPDSRRDDGGESTREPRQTPQANQPAQPAAQLADEPVPPTTPVDPIAATVAEAITHQPTWTRSATRAALTQAIGEGMDQALATKALLDIATGVYGPTIAGPQRLLAAGPWRQPGTAFVPAPSPAERATCRAHRGQPASNCRVCASERLAPPEPKSEPKSERDTVDDARAIARRAIQSATARWTEARRARTRVGAIHPATT